MKLNYLHFADYAFLTDLGKIGIIGIFERVYTKSFPTTHPVMYVVGQVGNITSETSLSLVIRKGKHVFVENTLASNLQDVVNPLRTYNFVIGVHNISFPEAGVYDFVLKSGDQEIGIEKLVVEKPVEGN